MTSTNLFVSGTFTLHSGGTADWKIECDALTAEDWITLAVRIKNHVRFHWVYGVPEGGMKLADTLRQYEEHDTSLPTLVVDDVLTTGASMEEIRRALPGEDVRGYVVFARGNCPDWVTPLFQYNTVMM